MSKIKVGYVGAGFIAQKVHIPNIARHPDVEFCALAELRPKLAKAVAGKFNIPKIYKDHREMCKDKEITAVGVSGHFVTQGEIAADLLLAGKNVFMEKPMAVSVEQAEKILNAEKKGGGRLMVAYMKRYDAGNVIAKNTIDEWNRTGEFGKITYVRNHGFCGSNWTAGDSVDILSSDEKIPPAPDCKIGWLPEKYMGMYIGYLQQYTHNVNLIRFFLDAKEARVKIVDLDADGYHGIVTLEVNGVRSIIESGSLAYHGWEEHTTVYFQKGWVKVWAPPLLHQNVPAPVEIYKGGGKSETITPFGGYFWSYGAEFDHFIRCLQDGKPFKSSGEDTLNDVRCFEDIFKKFIKNRE